MRLVSTAIGLLILVPLLGAPDLTAEKAPRRTAVAIARDAFHINGKPTYQGRRWKGHTIEGLLLNSRMVQATFDDLNPETRGSWIYPDTKAVGRRSQHPRIHRRHAGVATTRTAGDHRQPAGRQPARLFEGSALAQLGVHGRRRPAARVSFPSPARARSRGRAGNGRHRRLLLFRTGRAPARTKRP